MGILLSTLTLLGVSNPLSWFGNKPPIGRTTTTTATTMARCAVAGRGRVRRVPVCGIGTAIRIGTATTIRGRTRMRRGASGRRFILGFEPFEQKDYQTSVRRPYYGF